MKKYVWAMFLLGCSMMLSTSAFAQRGHGRNVDRYDHHSIVHVGHHGRYGVHHYGPPSRYDPRFRYRGDRRVYCRPNVHRVQDRNQVAIAGAIVGGLIGSQMGPYDGYRNDPTTSAAAGALAGAALGYGLGSVNSTSYDCW